MTWHSPLAFSLFFVILFILILLYFFKKSKKGFVNYSRLDLFSPSVKTLRAYLSPLPFLLKVIGLIFIIIALARPQKINQKSEQNVKGIDIMIVLDISLSMLVEDMGASLTRLSSAKKVVSQFIERRISDRIGLIVFSGESYTRVPLTLDYNLLLENLAQVKTTNSIKPGTAIGVALANASARLSHSDLKNRVIVFLTDGENNAGSIDPLTSLSIVKNDNIKVYTIGVGKVTGRAPIRYFSEDPFGRKIPQTIYIESRINKKLMKKMADETNGKFFMAEDSFDLEKVFKQIDQLEKQNIEVNQWTEYSEEYPPFLKFGLFSYLMAFLLLLTVFFRGV